MKKNKLAFIILVLLTTSPLTFASLLTSWEGVWQKTSRVSYPHPLLRDDENYLSVSGDSIQFDRRVFRESQSRTMKLSVIGPDHFEFIDDAGKIIPGTYELQGDQLTVCKTGYMDPCASYKRSGPASAPEIFEHETPIDIIHVLLSVEGETLIDEDLDSELQWPNELGGSGPFGALNAAFSWNEDPNKNITVSLWTFLAGPNPNEAKSYRTLVNFAYMWGQAQPSRPTNFFLPEWYDYSTDLNYSGMHSGKQVELVITRIPAK